MLRTVILGAAMAVVSLLAPVPAMADIKLGVIASRGEAAAAAQWGEFARYLQSRVGQPVVLMPMRLDAVEQAMSNGEIDLALANPVLAVSVQSRVPITFLASLNLPSGSSFGGVIVANPASGITGLADLKGKSVMGFSKNSAGAYLFQAYELKKAGVNVPDDLKLYQTAKKQDDVVLAVKAGIMDAGFVRTGVLEKMISEGKIKTGEVAVINSKSGFGMALSTELYPEWYLVAVTPVAKDAAEKVTAAAMALTPDSLPAKMAEISGFVTPIDPAGTVQLMKGMGLLPAAQ